jgi:hypothetical protein
LKILGQIVCEHCSRESGMQELLGVVDGRPMYAPLALRNVIGRERDLRVLECGHKVVKLTWWSAQEWLEGVDNSGAHIPVTNFVRANETPSR